MAFSIGDAAGGAGQGAAAGAQIGGPLGAGVGAVVGGLAGGILGGKARSAAKRAARAQRRIAAMTAFREKVGAQNSYEAQRAEAVAGAAAEGRMNDSSVQGALGAFATQQNAAFGFANAVEKQLGIVAKANAKAARYADYNQIAGQVSGIAGAGIAAGAGKAGQGLLAGGVKLGTLAGLFPQTGGANTPTIERYAGGAGGAGVFSFNPTPAAAPSFFSQNPVFKL